MVSILKQRSGYGIVPTLNLRQKVNLKTGSLLLGPLSKIYILVFTPFVPGGFGLSVAGELGLKKEPFMKKTLKQPKNAKEFDAYFENHDIVNLLDTQTKRVNIDFPTPILRRLDLKANELGLTRQALIKYWIAERLDLVARTIKSPS